MGFNSVFKGLRNGVRSSVSLWFDFMVSKKRAPIMAVASIAHHTSTIASCVVHGRLMWDFQKTVACYPVSLHIH